jgi:hypothetical protein
MASSPRLGPPTFVIFVIEFALLNSLAVLFLGPLAQAPAPHLF